MQLKLGGKDVRVTRTCALARCRRCNSAGTKTRRSSTATATTTTTHTSIRHTHNVRRKTLQTRCHRARFFSRAICSALQRRKRIASQNPPLYSRPTPDGKQHITFTSSSSSCAANRTLHTCVRVSSVCVLKMLVVATQPHYYCERRVHDQDRTSTHTHPPTQPPRLEIGRTTPALVSNAPLHWQCAELSSMMPPTNQPPARATHHS